MLRVHSMWHRHARARLVIHTCRFIVTLVKGVFDSKFEKGIFRIITTLIKGVSDLHFDKEKNPKKILNAYRIKKYNST